MNVIFPPIQIRTSDYQKDYNAIEIDRAALLSIFGANLKVTGGNQPRVFVHSGFENIKNERWGLLVGTGCNDLRSEMAAATAIEILAHHFHDYAIRESICGGKGFTWIYDLSNPEVTDFAKSIARETNLRWGQIRASKRNSSPGVN